MDTVFPTPIEKLSQLMMPRPPACVMFRFRPFCAMLPVLPTKLPPCGRGPAATLA
jgi:hypothetical protein